MSYKIIYEKHAKKSMKEIGLHYKEHANDDIAKNIISKIMDSVDVLSDLPLRFPTTDFSKNIRKLSVKKTPYIVYYFVGEDAISILEILHQRQDHSFLGGRYQNK